MKIVQFSKFKASRLDCSIKSLYKFNSNFFSDKLALYSKQFKFETFQNASFFQGTVSDFLSRNKVECSIHNVYDSVTINVNKCESNMKISEIADLIEHLYKNHRDISKGKIILDFSLPKNIVVPENNQKVQSSYKFLPNDKIYYESRI